MTIDELAQRSSTPTSTIRMYQSKALLPPPTREGRVGFYGPEHLARLRLIARLQGDGFSLAGIGRLLEAFREGRALDEVLGLEKRVSATWGNADPLVLTPQELASRFPGGSLPVELAQRAMSLGLVRLEGEHVIVNDPRFLEVGSELAEMGVPLSDVVEEYEQLVSAMAPIADRFTALFREHVWSRFLEHGLPQREIPDLVETLEHLNQLAEVIVVSTLRASFKASAEKFLAGEADALRGEGLDTVIRPLVESAGLQFPR